MTTFTNSEGLVITYTHDFLETILPQSNSSSNYYTTGVHNITFIEIGSNKILILEYTYQIIRNISEVYNKFKYD